MQIWMPLKRVANPENKDRSQKKDDIGQLRLWGEELARSQNKALEFVTARSQCFYPFIAAGWMQIRIGHPMSLE